MVDCVLNTKALGFSVGTIEAGFTGKIPFVRSLLRAGVQPTLDPSAETFMSVQCASPERGGELVGVCGVCASCVGWRKG